MPTMRIRRLLLATAALSTTLAACEKKKPVVYANNKGSLYDRDAGVVDATPAGDGGDAGDAGDAGSEPADDGHPK